MMSAGLKPRTSKRALVANHRPHPVIFIESVSGRAGTTFLAQPKVNAADNFSLLVEIFERCFHAPVEQHPAIDFDALLAAQIFRLANRRRGSGKIAAFHFVAHFVASPNLARR